ncbi:hypothetical protein BHE74_00057981 [Ensete ventricosum]|nr:hypothetical protein BHE74_00057981 [Ensete ventricosum]
MVTVFLCFWSSKISFLIRDRIVAFLNQVEATTTTIFVAGSIGRTHGEGAAFPSKRCASWFLDGARSDWQYRRRLGRYVGKARAVHIIREAVYIISIGTNDFLENYYSYVTGRFREFKVEEFEDFLIDRAADFLTAIYTVGARKISFTGLGAMGCLPLERTTNALHGGDCIEEYNKVARDFNVKLDPSVRTWLKEPTTLSYIALGTRDTQPSQSFTQHKKAKAKGKTVTPVAPLERI